MRLCAVHPNHPSQMLTAMLNKIVDVFRLALERIDKLQFNTCCMSSSALVHLKRAHVCFACSWRLARRPLQAPL